MGTSKYLFSAATSCDQLRPAATSCDQLQTAANSSGYVAFVGHITADMPFSCALPQLFSHALAIKLNN